MNETVTIEDRVGKYHFRRERKGGKIKQKLKRALKNKEKVTLCWIGELEMYCYPYKFPNQVFIGNFPFKGAKLDISDMRLVARAWIRGRSYLRGCYTKRGKGSKRPLNLELKAAYDYGLKVAEHSKKVKIPNSITTNVRGDIIMPVRSKIPKPDPRRDYDKWLDHQKKTWPDK